MKKVLTSPWVPDHINSSSDGAAIDIPDLTAAGISLPTTNWFIFAWIYKFLCRWIQERCFLSPLEQVHLWNLSGVPRILPSFREVNWAVVQNLV